MKILLLLILVPLASLLLNCLGFVAIGFVVLWPLWEFLKATGLYLEKDGLYSFGWCWRNS